MKNYITIILRGMNNTTFIKVDELTSGKDIINIVSEITQIPTAMMRITYGKREIYPTEETYNTEKPTNK